MQGATIPSSQHSKPATTSLAAKLNVAVVSSVSSTGSPRISATGGRSTIQVWLAGVGSTLRAASTARTANVCVPSSRPEISKGESQFWNAAPSREHWNVPLTSFETNPNVVRPTSSIAAGARVIVVSGGVVSAPAVIVHAYSAGGSSTCPNVLVACTSKVWAPLVSPRSSTGDVHGTKLLPSSEHSNVEPG